MNMGSVVPGVRQPAVKSGQSTMKGRHQRQLSDSPDRNDPMKEVKQQLSKIVPRYPEKQ